MITINFDENEYFDGETNEFTIIPATSATFEYSLIAVSKWEAKWKERWLGSEFRGLSERLIDFYMCMCLTPDFNREYITEDVAMKLSKYIDDSQTATTFTAGQNAGGGGAAGKVYSSEEIYALMFMNQVPIEFESRNLNRLLVTLRIIGLYSNPPKKMTQQEVMKQNAEINAQRKQALNTRG